MAKKDIMKEMKHILTEDKDFLKPILTKMLQEILEKEMDSVIGAFNYQRVEHRKGYRAGHYSRQLITRVGSLELRVPRDRDGQFSTELFQRYQRSERALIQALGEQKKQVLIGGRVAA